MERRYTAGAVNLHTEDPKVLSRRFSRFTRMGTRCVGGVVLVNVNELRQQIISVISTNELSSTHSNSDSKLTTQYNYLKKYNLHLLSNEQLC